MFCHSLQQTTNYSNTKHRQYFQTFNNNSILIGSQPFFVRNTGAVTLSFFARGDLPPFSTQSRQTGSVRQATVLTLARPLCPASACVKTFVRTRLAPFAAAAAWNQPTVPRAQWDMRLPRGDKNTIGCHQRALISNPRLICTKHAIDNMAL